MNALYSLLFVFLLVLIPLFGVGAAHLNSLFGASIPYTAFLIFIFGFIYKVFTWGRSPVPFRIPTTGGQFKSFDTKLFPQNKLDCPQTGAQTFFRMVLEVLAFRSLFRNTAVSLHETKGGPVVAYKSSKWLWLFAITFHYSFFMVALRHLRLFLGENMLAPINMLEFVDGILQIGAPTMYLTDIGLVAGVLLLLGRRLIDSKINYISYVSDYFPLFLILAIALSGIYMRYYAKVDVIAIKQLTMGLMQLKYVIPETVGTPFYVHIFLVSCLMAYFPFSKLMHLPGVFLSPTRNLPNDTRAKHHANPWNPDIKPHAYADYEKEFGVPMAEAGLPLDDPENGKAPEEAEA